MNSHSGMIMHPTRIKSHEITNKREAIEVKVLSRTPHEVPALLFSVTIVTRSSRIPSIVYRIVDCCDWELICRHHSL